MVEEISSAFWQGYFGKLLFDHYLVSSPKSLHANQSDF